MHNSEQPIQKIVTNKLIDPKSNTLRFDNCNINEKSIGAILATLSNFPGMIHNLSFSNNKGFRDNCLT